MEVGADGGVGDLEFFGGVGDGEAFDFDEVEGDAVAVGELLDGLEDDLEVDGIGEGVDVVVEVVGGVVDFVGVGDGVFGVEGGDGGVDHDGADPGVEGERVFEFVEGVKDLDETVVEDVFGCGGGAGVAEAYAIHLRGVVLVKLAVGFWLVGEAVGHQLFFVGFHCYFVGDGGGMCCGGGC